MRVPKYISPSALAKWESSREAFYMYYLASQRPVYEPQEPAMAVGSAFDAYVKAALYRSLFGHQKAIDDGYSLDALMTKQVEKHVRDWARQAGRHVFECYKYAGVYNELLAELEQAGDDPRFEFTAEQTVLGVPLKGKPDCCYVHASGAHVMLDWKVNGYCSKRATSPKKLYAMCRDGQLLKRPSQRAGMPHKNYRPMFFKGVTIGEHYLEDANPEWADQLAIYGWMTGEEPGTEDMVARIDQIVAKPRAMTPALLAAGVRPGDLCPTLRVANQRARISSTWQMDLIRRLQDCWRTILSGHIFPDMTKQENDDRCEVLDMVVEDMSPNDDPVWASLKAGYRR